LALTREVSVRLPEPSIWTEAVPSAIEVVATPVREAPVKSTVPADTLRPLVRVSRSPLPMLRSLPAMSTPTLSVWSDMIEARPVC